MKFIVLSTNSGDVQKVTYGLSSQHKCVGKSQLPYSLSITVQKTENPQDYLSDRTIHLFPPLDELKDLKIELKSYLAEEYGHEEEIQQHGLSKTFVIKSKEEHCENNSDVLARWATE